MKQARQRSSKYGQLPEDQSDARNIQGKFTLLPISSLSPHPQNPRKHSRQQIRALARSISNLGFTNPLLIDKVHRVLAGNGRLEAAKLLGLEYVPVIQLDHLSDAQGKALLLADNQLHDRSSWDEKALAITLKELSETELGFPLEVTGFEPAEIDIRIQSLEDVDAADRADEFDFVEGLPVSKVGDLWLLGDHRIFCGNALEGASYLAFDEGERAAAAFADAPYNVPIDGHVSGTGKIKHREFAMASGEMSEAEFTTFLTSGLSQIRSHTQTGALIYVCMDWRHIFEMCSAGRSSGCDLVNLCVWAKTNAGLGSLYRSRHELVFVLKNGKGSHVNNIQLGRFGRGRSNVWNYAGINNFTRKGTKRALEYHPTVKPILLVSDAIGERCAGAFKSKFGVGETCVPAAAQSNTRTNSSEHYRAPWFLFADF
jgi:hypothetical protein